MDKKTDRKIEQLNTYGVGHNSLISVVKVGKTTFIVSSYFETGKVFGDSLDNVIKMKLKNFQ